MKLDKRGKKIFSKFKKLGWEDFKTLDWATISSQKKYKKHYWQVHTCITEWIIQAEKEKRCRVSLVHEFPEEDNPRELPHPIYAFENSYRGFNSGFGQHCHMILNFRSYSKRQIDEFVMEAVKLLDRYLP
jgi:hypothetical protein